MIKCTKKSGTISITANYNNGHHHIPIGLMMEKNLSIIVGQSNTQKYWHMCLDKIRSINIDPTFVISNNIKINCLSEYYKQLNDEENGTLKCFIKI
jgi:threonine dehydrogenase-like Zn-dependent dehydrogenase